jgi:hypothetical protein
MVEVVGLRLRIIKVELGYFDVLSMASAVRQLT